MISEPVKAAARVWPFVCTNCGRHAPAGQLVYHCPTCGGVFDLDAPIPYAPSSPASDRGGLARFRSSFPLGEDTPWITLGEGGTPLIASEIDHRTVHFKCEILSAARRRPRAPRPSLPSLRCSSSGTGSW